MRRNEPSGRMTFPQLQRAVVTTADGLQRVAQSCASDFEQYGNLQQQLQALVVDLSVQVETLKIQIAGILARMDGKAAIESHSGGAVAYARACEHREASLLRDRAEMEGPS
jgi:hypothetical protein